MQSPKHPHPLAVRLRASTFLFGFAATLPGLLGASTSDAAFSEDTVPVDLPTVFVRAETQSDRVIQAPYLPDVNGTHIHAGKKSMVIDFDAMPQIQTDNYRQAFSKTPGLLTSELSNSSLLSLSFRGIGDPHESQNIMVLKDGIPFVLDPVGYPTVYFAPPFESIDRLEFIAGGGSLLYGAQPSGSLNYVTHEPDRSLPWRVTTQHVAGSHSLYSSYSTLEGGSDRFGYLADFDHRSGDSFRDQNSDFELSGGTLKLEWNLSASQRLLVGIDTYEADHGEPGGLSSAAYAADPDQAFLAHDRVRLDREVVRMGLDSLHGTTLFRTQIWASEVIRYSKRQSVIQNGGGISALSILNDRNTVNQHTYRTLGLDSRVRFDLDAIGDGAILTVGTTLMHIDAPIWNETGATADAERGVRTYQADRSTRYAAVFAETLFRLGRLTVTPSIRLDVIDQEIQEQIRSAGPRDLQDDTTEPLFGIALGYTTDQNTELYANISTAYKPKTYSTAFPTGAGITADDLEQANVITYEIGHRGSPTEWFTYDTSLFRIDYDDRFGRVGNNLENVGRSINQGLSLAAEVDFWSLIHGPSDFSVSGHLAYQYLDAEFVSGPLEGLTPQYAPDHMLRTGLTVRRGQNWKLSALLTYLDEHFANDNNTLSNRIPAYLVADLTAEALLWQEKEGTRPRELWLLAGVNNLFDERYFSRVRGNGIDPAAPRNVYVGLRAVF